jgi:hypothetical protein
MFFRVLIWRLAKAPGVAPALLGFIFCVSVGQAGCHKNPDQDSDLILTHQIEPHPPKVGPAEVTLALADKSGSPIRRAKVVLEGNMSHPGMRPVFGDAPEVEPGQYRGSLDFIMSGDWVVTVHLTLEDGRTLSRKLEVNGVKPQ